MYFKFRGIDSRDMGVTVLRRPNIISPEMRTWTTFIDGKDGAYSHPMGLKPNSFNFTIAVEDVENIDKVLGWLAGRGRFIRSDLPNRYLNVHINEGVRLHRTVEWLYQGEVTVQVVDPFWYSIKDEWQEYKPNLIKNGWDDYVPYGSGENYVDNWDFSSDDMIGWSTAYGENKIINNQLVKIFDSDHSAARLEYYTSTIPEGEYVFRIKIKSEFDISIKGWENVSYKSDRLNSNKDFTVWEQEIAVLSEGTSRFRFYGIGETLNKKMVVDWIQITPVDDQHLVVEKTPLENGLTRIQTWGGNNRIKLSSGTVPNIVNEGDMQTRSLYVKNLGEGIIRFDQDGGTFDGNPRANWGVGEYGQKHFTGVFLRDRTGTNSFIRSENDKSLDFIAGSPQIVEGDEPILENEGNYPSKPIIKLVKGEGKSVTIKTKDSYLTYTFPNRETEVEIDTTTKTATYNGETRDRFVETDAVEVEFPPGPIDIQVEGGTAYFKKKDRWI